jgi:hypothetical protein
MKILDAQTRLLPLLSLFVFLWMAAYAQITPSADAYANTADSTTNYGTGALLYVNGAIEAATLKEVTKQATL